MSSDNQSPEPTSTRPAGYRIVAAGAALLAVFVAVLVATGGAWTDTGNRSRPNVGSAAGARADSDQTRSGPSAERTVVVYDGREPAPSAPGTVLNAMRISGKPPMRPIVATVLTDEDCAPDPAGVSHCRNALALPGGRRLTVRHPHRMTDVPCLTPGERVRLKRAV